MKKRYILSEFLLIFVFLILPPLFVSKGSGLSKAASFSPIVFIQLAIAAVLYIQYKLQFTDLKNSMKIKIFKIPFWWSITLGSLMLIFALMQTLELFLEKETLSRNLLPAINSPMGWFFLTFSVFTGAFYEEVLYRQFMPEFLLKIFESKAEKKWCLMAIEAFPLIIFALSHRYLGWIPVFNALACGSVLRLCYRKTFSVWTGMTAHFTYNMTLIVFSLLSR
ncbi:CPBP family intramembrane glutamic endopeptidase [Treponema sp.]|uniref:CPBP family intramembrane glutamic endopeptidase n=1 Tax=Treponema sp. TaxID=166 RepID=UPI00298D93F6|nr:CPBP family intramembrane glutamic endopeptidase [Treponema sp.]MCQ2240630.1 CPBP family glutamic-type intramembrane protease [Treponema sp.]